MPLGSDCRLLKCLCRPRQSQRPGKPVASRRSLAIDAASWLDVGVDLDQDDDPGYPDGIDDQDTAVGVWWLESLGPFLVEDRHMIGVSQEAECLDHVRDLTPRRLDCLLEILERQRDLAPVTS